MEFADRREAIEKSLEDYTANNGRRTETLEYRGQSRSLEVVILNPSLPLLNHDNSRLAAQLSSHPQKLDVLSHPTSETSQDTLSGLLRNTEKFKDLREEMEALGQQSPGIITRDGVLVNGNTRLVAARDIGADGFVVAVLPDDATSEDCFDIEMALQLRKLTHQDYTFTNRVLLISRFLERGHSEDELCKRMNWMRGGRKKLEQHQRLLALVEEIRTKSENPLDYAFFDDKEQMLKDLDQKFESLSAVSLADAQQMKWTRILGMVLGVNKDQVRAIDEDFVGGALARRVDGNTAGEFLQKFEKIRGQTSLDDLLGASEESFEPEIDMEAAVAKVLEDSIEGSGDLSDERLEEHHELRKAIRNAAEALIENDKQAQLRSQPHQRLSEVRMRVEEILDRLPELFRDAEFDRRKFEFEAKKALKVVSQLNEELQRQVDKKP